MRTDVLTKYRERLASLASMKGRRNSSLLGLATLGVMAGLGDDRILAEVRAASGTPPLTDAEITHALRTAHKDTQAIDRNLSPRWTPTKPKPPPLFASAAGYVGRMTARGAGATFATLSKSSPLAIPTDPKAQAAAFLLDLYADADLLFLGDKIDKGEIGKNILPAAGWQCAIGAGLPLPPLVIANPLTGAEGMTKEGKPSYRCGECVAAFRFALVEFDELPMEHQAAFWAGVITTGTLPLRSLVYSGGKSMHGLVEIGATGVDAWRRSIEKLLYAVANPNAHVKQRADRACKNPDRLTRLPGATRPDKDTVQTLLWLASR